MIVLLLMQEKWCPMVTLLAGTSIIMYVHTSSIVIVKLSCFINREVATMIVDWVDNYNDVACC